MGSALAKAIAIGVIIATVGSEARAQRLQDSGKREYIAKCAVCHGEDGRGKGPLHASLKTPPADLTQIQKRSMGVFPFDHVYQIIDGRKVVQAHGPRTMPVWGNEYTSAAEGYTAGTAAPNEIDSYVRGRIIALIGYISSLQAK